MLTDTKGASKRTQKMMIQKEKKKREKLTIRNGPDNFYNTLPRSTRAAASTNKRRKKGGKGEKAHQWHNWRTSYEVPKYAISVSFISIARSQLGET